MESECLNFAFIDQGLEPAVEALRYLGSHMGAENDHANMFLDINEDRLFQGIFNHPIMIHSQELLLVQSDKVKTFLEELIPKLKEHALSKRTFRLSCTLVEHGKSKENMSTYVEFYKQVKP